jgi:hypothetical protein
MIRLMAALLVRWERTGPAQVLILRLRPKHFRPAGRHRGYKFGLHGEPQPKVREMTDVSGASKTDLAAALLLRK